MESNRESARRSRMRKQNHLDELTVQVSHLSKTKQQLISNISVTTQQYLKVEAENSVLRAQMSELISRLQSLNEISSVLSACNNNHGGGGENHVDMDDGMFPIIIQEPFASDSFFMNPWDTTTSFNQPIMASATMFQN